MFGLGKKQSVQKPETTAKMGRKATISARVFRAKTGKWEDLGVIARPFVPEETVQNLKKEYNIK